jgi:hypothetical protein
MELVDGGSFCDRSLLLDDAALKVVLVPLEVGAGDRLPAHWAIVSRAESLGVTLQLDELGLEAADLGVVDRLITLGPTKSITQLGVGLAQ